MEPYDIVKQDTRHDGFHEAKLLLDLLVQGDSSTWAFLFVAVAESAEARAKVKAGLPSWTVTDLCHDSFPRAYGRLRTLNRNGYAIFVTANLTTTYCSRKAEDIENVRVFFIDWDRKLAATPPDLSACPPALSVETRGSSHHYWPVVPEMQTERSEWKTTQRHLAAALHTDPAVCDLPRVMRVPGFFHLKQEPFYVRATRPADGLESFGGFTGLQLRSAFPLPDGVVLDPIVSGPNKWAPLANGMVDDALPQRVQAELAVLDHVARKDTACEWTSLCPVHEADGRTHTPSLSIALSSSGAILYHCWAGCTYEEIRAALNERLVASLPATDVPEHIRATLDLFEDYERTPSGGWCVDCPVCNGAMALHLKTGNTKPVVYFCRERKCSFVEISAAISKMIDDILGDDGENPACAERIHE